MVIRRAGSPPLPGTRLRGCVYPKDEGDSSAGEDSMLRGLVSFACVLAAGSAAAAGGTGVHPVRTPAASTSRPVDARASARAFPGSLPFFYDLYTFRGGSGKTSIVAAFAVPAGRLRKENTHDGVRYRFDVTLVLADTALKSVTRTDDTVYVASPHSLDDEHLLHTYIEVQAPPSVTTLERVVMNDASTPGIGQMYGSPFPVPDYTGHQLMLSDVVLGLPDPKSGWKRGDVRLELLPTSEFPKSAFDVYYEIYNLPAGHSYATEIGVQRIADENGNGENTNVVRAKFTGQAAPRPDGSVHELRHLGSSLSKGRYRLTVTVTDEDTGQKAKRSRVFNVRGWGRGSTLVPALPWRKGAGSQGTGS